MDAEVSPKCMEKRGKLMSGVESGPKGAGAALGVTPGIEGEKQKARRSPGKDLRVSSKRDTKRAAKLLLLRAQILKQHPCGCGSQQNVHGKERKTGVWSGKWNKGCRRGFGSDSRKKLCLFVSGGHFGNGWSECWRRVCCGE